MKDYAVTLLSVLAFSALMLTLAPKGKGEKGVRFALSVLLLFTLLSPFFGGELLSELQTGALREEIVSVSEAGVSAGNAYYEKAHESAVSEILKETLCRDFSVEREKLTLDLTCRYDEAQKNLLVTEIKLHLYGTACLADAHGMLVLLKRETGAECEVIYHRA